MIFSNVLTAMLARPIAARTARITRAPDFIIGDRADPYMLRWWLIPRNPIFNVYLHEFRRDDEDRAHHDHPWLSLSISLTEWLVEEYTDRDGKHQTRVVWPGMIVIRRAKFAHRMIVPKPGARTIFITGPRIRTWGFLCGRDTAAGGWRPWHEFVARDKGQIGRGCD